MTTRISPQEFLFQESLTPIQVQTVVLKDLLDDGEQLLQHVRHFKLAAGTVILVQVMNEAKDTLLREASFRVSQAKEIQRVVEDDYHSSGRPITQYTVERWTPWKSSSFVEETEAEVFSEPEREAEEYVPGEATLEWSYEKKVWNIMVGGKVWTTVERNEDEPKAEYKARALAIAAGSERKAA